MTKRKQFGILFVVVFLSLMGLFALSLHTTPNKIDLATKNQKIPPFSLPNLLADGYLSNVDLRTENTYYLVNFWGSWCPACYQEHPYLMQLSQHETLYGVNWKDKQSAGKNFLRQGGNPFESVIVDNHSELAIGMGVYGAPETFLVKKNGTIMMRYAGPLSESVWQNKFVPVIRTLKSNTLSIEQEKRK